MRGREGERVGYERGFEGDDRATTLQPPTPCWLFGWGWIAVINLWETKGKE